MSKEVVNQNGNSSSALVSSDVTIVSKEQYDKERALLKEINSDGYFDNAIGIQKKYWERPSEGETIQGIFIGFEPITSQRDGSMLPAIVIRTKDGDYMSAATALLDAFADFLPDGYRSKIPINTPVRIVCTGEKKTGTGNKMLTFDVKAKL